MWGIGVVLFELAYGPGRTPWSGKGVQQLHTKILELPLRFPARPTRSRELKSLIAQVRSRPWIGAALFCGFPNNILRIQCLQLEPSARPTSRQLDLRVRLAHARFLERSETLTPRQRSESVGGDHLELIPRKCV